MSNVLTYPLALIVTRLQIQRVKTGVNHQVDGSHHKGIGHRSRKNTSSFNDAAWKILAQEEGLKSFWNGVGADTWKTVLDAFLFFYAYNFLRKSRVKRRGNPKHLPILDELGVGFFAGAFSKLVTTPLANVVTRKQTSSGIASSTKSIAVNIYEERGYKGFWAGYTASLILTLNPSLTFFLFETLKRLLIPRRKREGLMDAKITFLLAAMSKATASSVTYPFSLAKARLQTSSSLSNQQSRLNIEKTHQEEEKKKAPTGSERRLDGQNDASNTVFGTVHRIFRAEGFGALYEGLGGEVTKGFFSHGITMMLKDVIHSIIVQLYLVVLRLLRNARQRRLRKR